MAELADNAVTVYFDGAARPNPGPASSGALLVDGAGNTIAHAGFPLGVATNNFAEWRALEIGLEAALALNGIRRVRVLGDSQLVINQAFGSWSISDERLEAVATRVAELIKRFELVEAQHIPAARNAAADTICDAVLMGKYLAYGEVPALDTVPLTFVLHVRVPETLAGSANQRAQLRRELLATIGRGFPIATVDVKRASDHGIPTVNGHVDLAFIVSLCVTAASGRAENRKALTEKLCAIVQTAYPGATEVTVFRTSG